MGHPIDRRVQRTKALLHGALVALIHEKPYDGLVVKEILARANVGRSTFYSHFRDKEELLSAGLCEMLRKCAASGGRPSDTRAEHVLRFSMPLLQHIDSFRAGTAAAGDRTRQGVVHERLRAALTDWLVQELLCTCRRGWAEDQIPVALLAEQVASTFVLVLSRWLESETRSSASSANSQFLALSLPVLASVLAP
jgi:AcrR family transcriptional regulator